MLIKIRPPYLANMIAAGEVVERPASVVKELAENSIDAGATAVTVEIESGGVSLIRVSDNGCGIPREDTSIAFLRHATSKIDSPDDLEHIMTLGFRGEALASICAVAKLEMVTKTDGEECGVKIVAEAGDITEQGDIGCPQVTSIAVRNLFFNTPARIKFLKRDATEAGYIEEYVRRLAMAHPEVSFRMTNGGKEKLFTAGDNSLKNAAYSIYGVDVAKELIEVKHSDGGITVTGLIGRPTLYRKNRSFQRFFINGRYIVNRTATAALEEGYKSQLLGGSFPVAILHIGVAPEFVDVNVHPAKLEVKFSDDTKVFQAVYWAVKNALSSSFSLPEVELKNAEIKPQINVSHIPQGYAGQHLKARLTGGEELQIPMPPKGMQEDFLNSVFLENQKTEPETSENKAAEYTKIVYQQEKPPQQQDFDGGEQIKIIGQLFGTYILVEKAGTLYILDQHAAHERLIYERLLTAKENHTLSPQLMLTPIVVGLSPIEAEAVKANTGFFEELGFELEDYGNNDIAVRQVPYATSQDAIKDMVVEIAGMLSKGHSGGGRRAERALYTIACKAAIKANRLLNEAEIKSLLNDVSGLYGINTCPHGRPFTVKLSKQEIEKLFKRTN